MSPTQSWNEINGTRSMMSDTDSVFLIPQRHQYGVDDRLVLRVLRDFDNNRRLLAHLHR
jgi:hypothetical protein